MRTMCSREIFTKKCRQQTIFDSDLKGAWHYNHVTFNPIAKNFMLYCRLIYMLSILCVRTYDKVKVGIPESFKVGWYPPKKTGSSHLKLLGVYVQNDLQWNTHVSSIVSKACKRIHYLRVCRTAHLPRDIGLTTYITKIRPVLEYASPVWGGLPIYLEEDLQRVQNRCLNVIGLPRDTVESPVTRRLNLTRKEFKRILESEAHPCKPFLDKPVDHGL